MRQIINNEMFSYILSKLAKIPLKVIISMEITTFIGSPQPGASKKKLLNENYCCDLSLELISFSSSNAYVYQKEIFVFETNHAKPQISNNTNLRQHNFF